MAGRSSGSKAPEVLSKIRGNCPTHRKLGEGERSKKFFVVVLNVRGVNFGCAWRISAGIVRSLVVDLCNERLPSFVLDRYRTYCMDSSGNWYVRFNHWTHFCTARTLSL